MEVEMARAGAAGRSHLRRHVRLQSSRRRIEHELRYRRPAFERYEHETISGISADVMRHRTEAELSRLDCGAEAAISANRDRRDRSLLGIAVVRDEQPAARPVGGQMRSDAAHRRHIIYWRQRTVRLVDGE